MTAKSIGRQLLAVLLAAPILVAVSSPVEADGVPRKLGQKITVYKSPTCGCCQGWADYLQDNGFNVETVDTSNLHDIKKQHGLTDPRLASCHTAVVDGYVVEGHVPADDIWRLLSERPAVVGVTAPGMPQLSPGMRSAPSPTAMTYCPLTPMVRSACLAATEGQKPRLRTRLLGRRRRTTG